VDGPTLESLRFTWLASDGPEFVDPPECSFGVHSFQDRFDLMVNGVAVATVAPDPLTNEPTQEEDLRAGGPCAHDEAKRFQASLVRGRHWSGRSSASEYCASRSNRVARRNPRLPCPRGEIRVAQHDLVLCSRRDGPVSVRAFSCNASEILLVSIPADEQPPVCLCSQEVAPVCGEDGRTYANRCLAVCAGEAVAYDGPC